MCVCARRQDCKVTRCLPTARTTVEINLRNRIHSLDNEHVIRENNFGGLWTIRKHVSRLIVTEDRDDDPDDLVDRRAQEEVCDRRTCENIRSRIAVEGYESISIYLPKFRSRMRRDREYHGIEMP